MFSSRRRRDADNYNSNSATAAESKFEEERVEKVPNETPRRRERPARTRQRTGAEATAETNDNDVGIDSNDATIPVERKRVNRAERPERAARAERSARGQRNAALEDVGTSSPGVLSSKTSKESDIRAPSPIIGRSSKRRPSGSTSDYFNSIASFTLKSLFDGDDQNLDRFTSSDSSAINLIFQQASRDSQSFTVLTLEKYTEQTNRLTQIQGYYESLQAKLRKEIKIKEEAERSLQQNPADRESQKQVLRSDAKMMDVSRELWQVTGDLIMAERTVMKHICGAIKLKSNEVFDAPTLKVDRSAQDTKRKLAAAEDKVQQLNTQVEKLNDKIKRLEMTREKPLPSPDENTDDLAAVSSLRSPRRTPPGSPPRARAERNGGRSSRAAARGGDTAAEEEVSQLKSELESVKSELRNLEELHKIQIESISKSYQKEKEKSLESIRKATRDEIESKCNEEIALLKKQQQSQLDEINQVAELEKTEFKVSFQKEQLEYKYKLESSEQALVDAKRQFFNEREKFQETIDILENKLSIVEREMKLSSDSFASKKEELEQSLLELEKTVEEAQKSLAATSKSLESKSQELIVCKQENDAEVERLTQSFEGKIVELEREVNDLVAVQKQLQDAEKNWQESEESLKSALETQTAEVDKVKAKASEEVYKAQDSLFEANEQLNRMARLLKDVNFDVDRYRKIASERDQELLDLKKMLRNKDKELVNNALSSAPESSRLRRLVEQKDADIDSKRAELRSLKADLASLQRKLEVKDREIDEAKAQMMRAAGSNQDELTVEIGRMQVMLLDLKTTRVDLLEQLDDSQHEVETLKNKLNKLLPPKVEEGTA